MARTSAPLATVGIISIGDMGLGVAKLLTAHNYEVITNVSDRSESTQKRASSAQIRLVPSDPDLVAQADYILSIVPPRDARATARRFIAALPQSRTSNHPLYYLDLNAIAPSTSASIAADFSPLGSRTVYVDGGIIGGPPQPKAKPFTASTNDSSHAAPDDGSSWVRPSIVLSGPHPLSSAPKSGAHLFTVLNGKHVADAIGTASGLKCCFASLTKGYTAIAIQSYSTAAALGVLPELEAEMAEFNPSGLDRARRGIVGMAPKAGRWVEEMREIGRAFEQEGLWAGENIFEQVAGVYDVVSRETVLGSEKVGERTRGTSYGDAVDAIREGLDGRK